MVSPVSQDHESLILLSLSGLRCLQCPSMLRVRQWNLLT